MKSVSNIATLAVVSFFFFHSFASGKDMFGYDWTDHPDIRRTGVQPDEPIFVKSNGVLFKIPAAYFHFWPTKKMVGRVLTANSNKKYDGGINFTFWMPDRTPYPFKTWIGRLEYHEGKKNKTPRFNVQVDGFRFQKAEEYISPRQRYLNMKRLAEYVKKHGKKYYESSEDRFGLNNYRGTQSPYPKSYDDGEIYFSYQGTQPQISFLCFKHQKPIPSCKGRVHFNDINLAFHIRFSKPALSRWREIVSAVRELALSWRVESTGQSKK